MDIDLKKKNKLDLKPFIKVIKVFSILAVCRVKNNVKSKFSLKVLNPKYLL